MSQVVLNYSLDLGSCGQRECKVLADVLTDFTGKLYLEIVQVLIEVEGVTLDLYPHIRERDVAAMREGLKNAYWSEMARHLRDAGGVA